jgi:hypothetical protein
MLVTAALVVAGLSFAFSALIAFLFYRDFFAADGHPIEWKLLYAGLIAFGAEFALLGVFERTGRQLLVQASAFVGLIGAALLLVGCFILWKRFRL